MLQGSNVKVRKLQTQCKEANHPQVLVPAVNFFLSVSFAAWFFLAPQALHVLALLKGVEEKNYVVISFQDRAERVHVRGFLFCHLQVDGLAVMIDTIGLRLTAVACNNLVLQEQYFP